MKRILTFVVSLLIFLPSFAQQYVVDGNIYDATSKEPLFYATASLFTPKGTLLLSQQTDSVGHFKLSTFHPGKYKLKLSYVGYDKLEKEILFTLKQPTLHYDSLHLNSIEVQLKEAIVKATAARVQQKGDTTQYNASAYRTPVGSTLKSLIKQLPGVEVKDDGGILFHGKKINQFLINGKDFFKSKTDVAMDNLPVELVKNIKAYSKKSEHAEQTGTDDEEENHVLDITTKKEFKRTLFSVFNLGYGRKERYQINSFTSRFTENSRISTFFDCNNTRGYSGHPNTKSIGTDFSFSNGKKKYTSGYLELEGNAFYHYNGNNLYYDFC